MKTLSAKVITINILKINSLQIKFALLIDRMMTRPDIRNENYCDFFLQLAKYIFMKTDI
jgi:hypothetical protein